MISLYEMVRLLQGKPPPLQPQDTAPAEDVSQAARRSVEASDSLLEAVQKTMDALGKQRQQ